MWLDTLWVLLLSDDETMRHKPTCLSLMWVTLSLLTATSHTHTTELAPAVMMVVGLGETAHSVSPQLHKLSHTAKVWRWRDICRLL